MFGNERKLLKVIICLQKVYVYFKHHLTNSLSTNHASLVQPYAKTTCFQKSWRTKYSPAEETLESLGLVSTLYPSQMNETFSYL